MKRTTAREKCTAHSTQTGKRCENWPIRGANVCRKHGGGAPQVKEAARRRLLELVAPALSVLDEALRQKEDRRAGLDAAKDVLNRAGLKSAEQIELSAPDGEPLFDLSQVPTDKLELIMTTLVNARRKPEETPEEEN